MSEHIVAIFIAELILLLAVGRMLGEVLNRFGQPAIFGQLLAGVLLGPSVFGALLPEVRHIIFPGIPLLGTMIDAVSQIGVLLLLLLTGMETMTIMEPATGTDDQIEARSVLGHLTDAARDTLARTPPAEKDTAASAPPLTLDELLQVKLIKADDTLEKEAVKGYSIAIVGIDQPFSATSHRFDDQIQRLVDTFDGPLGIVINARPRTETSSDTLRLLVPTGGTIEARLATEIALALAKAGDGTVTALHVFDPRDDVEILRGRSRRQGLSVLVDARRLGKRSGVPVTGLTLSHSRPEAAIERAARLGTYDLVVVGTSLRQGERQFLGARSLALIGLLRTPILLIVK